MARRKKKETGAVLLRLPVSLIQKIDDAATKFKRHSRNQVASEIVETYFDLWKSLERKRAELLAKQYATLIQTGDEANLANSSRSLSRTAIEK